MTERERRLAMVVGGLALLGLISMGAQRLSGMFTSRQDQIAMLEKSISDKRLEIQRGQRATQELTSYERRSLPPNVDVAGSLYRAWLIELVTRSGLSEATVKMLAAREHRDIYHELPFAVTAQGDLEQIVRLLHDFYSADYLHRIRNATLKPIEGTPQLNLSLTIESLAMHSAPMQQKLAPRPAEQLSAKNVEAYVNTIVKRNIFAPPNKAPNLAVPTLPPVYKGRTATFKLAGSDPDPAQKLTYSLDKHEGKQDVAIDPQSGEIRITAQEVGPIQLAVRVTDNGIPAQSATAVLRMDVLEPPGEIPSDVSPAKFTYLTAITLGVEGRYEVWLNVRSEGRMLRLFEGDTFNVGGVEGVVTRIGRRTVEIQYGGKRAAVGLGQNLAERRELGTGEEAEG